MIKYHRRYLDEGEKQRRWIDPRLYSVRPEDLRAYLLHRQWKEVPSDRPGFLVFEEPVAGADGPLYQFVPETDWEGYAAQVYGLIAALAVIEDRYAGDVLTDILQLRAADSPAGNGPATPSRAETAQR
ncbi:MAG: hypothetical protein L0Z62_49075 [Gemmataceae bacterium]|nr:hypothetical protein [Gemmataceae bacterium]